MSTTPLRLDAGLVNEARAEATIFDRSPTAQIEFWAKLGRVVCSVFSHDSIKVVKGLARVQDINALLANADTPAGRARFEAEVARHGVPTYSADPKQAGVIIETRPDGKVRRGRFANKRFMPLAAGTTAKARCRR